MLTKSFSQFSNMILRLYFSIIWSKLNRSLNNFFVIDKREVTDSPVKDTEQAVFFEIQNLRSKMRLYFPSFTFELFLQTLPKFGTKI